MALKTAYILGLYEIAGKKYRYYRLELSLGEIQRISPQTITRKLAEFQGDAAVLVESDVLKEYLERKGALTWTPALSKELVEEVMFIEERDWVDEEGEPSCAHFVYILPVQTTTRINARFKSLLESFRLPAAIAMPTQPSKVSLRFFRR